MLGDHGAGKRMRSTLVLGLTYITRNKQPKDMRVHEESNTLGRHCC